MLLWLAATMADPAPACAGMTLPAAVADYATRIQAMDVDRIGALFAPDGVAEAGGKTLTGAAENAEFLKAYAAYRVTSEAITIETLSPAPGGWAVAARFHQTGLTPDAKPYDAQGRLQITWRCLSGEWRIARLATLPN